MITPQINKTVLMSGADFFDNQAAINPFMNHQSPIDRVQAQQEHATIKAALQAAGVNVVQVQPPADCQDGVYTANWALVRGDKAVLATLPNARKGEEPYAEQVLKDLGKKTYKIPNGAHCSGQGDALPCGNYLFCGTGYRTEAAAQQFMAERLDYEIINLITVPKRSLFGYGKPSINKHSGWPESYFYDIDLALSVLRAPTDTERGLIAWCPDAFLPDSRQKLHEFNAVDKIEVSLAEAKNAFATNLVSTGSTVIMSANAPLFRADLERNNFKIVTPAISELSKGGGYIRCITLTLDNI